MVLHMKMEMFSFCIPDINLDVSYYFVCYYWIFRTTYDWFEHYIACGCCEKCLCCRKHKILPIVEFKITQTCWTCIWWLTSKSRQFALFCTHDRFLSYFWKIFSWVYNLRNVPTMASNTFNIKIPIKMMSKSRISARGESIQSIFDETHFNIDSRLSSIQFHLTMKIIWQKSHLISLTTTLLLTTSI